MIAIIHFGGQYTQLIRRRLNELGVAGEVIPSTALPAEVPDNLDGVILSGGPASVDEQAAAHVRHVMEWGVPILGICFGHQLLVHCTGGVVRQQFAHEYGKAWMCLTAASALTRNLFGDLQVWVSHGDSVEGLPEGWKVIGRTSAGPYTAIEHRAKRLYGVQFHPEVTHTPDGIRILYNFALNICAAPMDYSPQNLAQSTLETIREHVGSSDHMMVACSLGVDSTTVTALCAQALGAERVHPVFIDTGLQREEDLHFARQAHDFLPPVQVVDAQEAFLAALAGQVDHRVKRRRVGETFWQVLAQAAKNLGKSFPIECFSMGTIAPDVIESGAESGQAATIKLHHNRVKRPSDFPFVPFEPIQTLYKDQVRAAGREVGVSEEILTRHPFPGPGFAVRVLGEVTPEKLAIVRQCDVMFVEWLRATGRYHSASQAGACVLNDKCTCVRGDGPASKHVVALWAVHTEDFMTADIVPLPWEELADLADSITNKVSGAGIVTYRLSRKPPATIE
jgi:GMP synthase (glutamine-hydrolysing)